MRKRVLLAEQSDAIRGVAETVLRQNGFEVVSVSNGEKAMEVLKLSRPDLLIIGADLTTAGEEPLYERIRNDSKSGDIAMLLFGSADANLPFPSEMIIPRPFDPKEFLEKAIVFSGRYAAERAQPAPAANPLDEADLNDDFLDAALGLDDINVTDSEIMDKTGSIKLRPQGRASTDSPGFGSGEDAAKRTGDSGKIESLMIRDADATDIRRPVDKKKSKEGSSAAGKLDILPDQYGLSDPDALETEAENKAHDYQWFIDEMRKEVQQSGQQETGAAGAAPQQPPAQELAFTDPASTIEPVTPASASGSPSGTDRTSSAEDVEKFLDEFKKEVEKFEAHEPETVHLGPEPSPQEGEGDRRHIWQDSAENLTAEDVALFTRQLCTELAEKIAKKIVAKIDNKKLLNLLKTEMLAHGPAKQEEGE